MRDLEALVLGLDLRRITLVLQDLGGPIGLALAARHPARVRALVILNSFGVYPLHPSRKADGLRLPPPLRLMRSRPLGTWLVRKRGMFDRMVMKLATGTRMKAVHHACTGMSEGPRDRGGLMASPHLIPTHSSHPVPRVEALRSRLAGGVRSRMFFTHDRPTACKERVGLAGEVELAFDPASRRGRQRRRVR